MKLSEYFKLKKFTVYDREENSVLELIEEASENYNKIVDCIDELGEHNSSAEIIEARKGKETLRKKIDEIDDSINNLNSNKADKNEVFHMENMGQDIKLAMTGGSVPVVGINGILTEHIKDKQVTVNKTDFFDYTDIMIRENYVSGTMNSTGTVVSGDAYTSDFIPVYEGMNIEIPGNISHLCYFNVNKKGLSSYCPRISNLSNYKGVIPSTGISTNTVKYIRVSWSTVEGNTNYRNINDIKIFNSDKIKMKKQFENKTIEREAINFDFAPFENSDLKDDNIYFNWNSGSKILTIYMATVDGYLGYNFRRMTAEYDANNSASNYDIWRLRNVKVYEKHGNEFINKHDVEIIHNASEWECAIKETGMSDFSGGSTHGDEFLDSIVFMLDGAVYTNPSDFANKTCKELRIIRKSKLFRSNSNSAVQIANHYVDYLFKKNEITINNRIDWLVNTNCGISYLCMLGVKREVDGLQITNKGIKGGDGEVLDLSIAEHGNSSTTKMCTSAYAWNDGSNGGLKINCNVEILENNFFPSFNFKFDDRAEYNKFYFDQCGMNFEVKKGDIWYNKAKYKIDYLGEY